jgi:hypothetical protein
MKILQLFGQMVCQIYQISSAQDLLNVGKGSILRGLSVPDRIGTLIALERLSYCRIRNWEVKIMVIVTVLSVYREEKYEDSIHDRAISTSIREL